MDIEEYVEKNKDKLPKPPEKKPGFFGRIFSKQDGAEEPEEPQSQPQNEQKPAVDALLEQLNARMDFMDKNMQGLATGLSDLSRVVIQEHANPRKRVSFKISSQIKVILPEQADEFERMLRKWGVSHESDKNRKTD